MWSRGRGSDQDLGLSQGGEKDTKISCRRAEKGSSRGLARAEARGIFRHQGMGRSLPHDMVPHNTRIALSLHQHTRQSHPLQLRVSLPKYSFLLLAKQCIPDFRTLLPNLTPSDIVNPRHLIFRPGASEVDQSTQRYLQVTQRWTRVPSSNLSH